jgi:hypothetical protein
LLSLNSNITDKDNNDNNIISDSNSGSSSSKTRGKIKRKTTREIVTSKPELLQCI